MIGPILYSFRRPCMFSANLLNVEETFNRSLVLPWFFTFIFQPMGSPFIWKGIFVRKFVDPMGCHVC